MQEGSIIQRTNVVVHAGAVPLEGDLARPEAAEAIVLFAHGSGSSRHSPLAGAAAGRPAAACPCVTPL
jgi:hypothetical protein